MQQTIQRLRIALPIVFFAFLLIIVLSWSRNRARKDSTTTQPVVATRTGDKPRAESQGFEDTQTVGGRLVSRIRAQRVVSYTSNWTTLEGVQLTIYRPNGLTYELICPEAQFNSQTKEADAKGGVKVTSSDGIEIATAEIRFDGSRLSNRIPVEFRIDRWNGRAGALDLDVEAETLRLFESITATMTPSAPAEAPMTLRSDEALFRRKESQVVFERRVEMTRAADRLVAERMVVFFTSDRKDLIGFEGGGGVVVRMSSAAAPGEDLGGMKEIRASRFVSELGPDGRIRAINTFGDAGISEALLEGPPRREVKAKNFRIALEGRSVNEMRAEIQVVMKEFGPEPREVTAERVTVSFDPATHKAMSALLEENVRYRDPKNTASAVRAQYDIANDRVLLTAQPGFDATVVADGQTIKAKQIEFAPRASTATASGGVIAQLVPREGGPAVDATTVFPANKPVFVNADTLTLRQSAKVAAFSGNVRAWQDANTLFSNEMLVQGGGDLLIAKGAVRALLFNAGEARRTPLKAESEQLQAKKAERRIDLLGSVKIEDEERIVTSQQASFFFDANRKVDRIEADRDVVVLDRINNRKGTGDHATYHVKQKMVFVSGSPATVSDPKGNLAGQRIAIDLNRNRVEIVSATQPTKGSYKP
ncbi:MAG TPA: LPS export ABC transporter periplasmic protein LptC [Thermoanaerobaculia bacterium]|nr:LPS export ABC transporter periplasmic protein LptC [Thermoanaerobaculia bacterium]